MFLVGLAVAVTVVTCRRKSEASERGMASRGGIVRVGRRAASERGESWRFEGMREWRLSGCRNERAFAEGGNGGMAF